MLKTTQRLFASLLLLLVFTVAAQATTITVSGITVQSINWAGPTTLRIYATGGSFFTSDGRQVLGSTVGSSTVYKIVNCTINPTTHEVTIPSFTIDTTDDSTDNPAGASYTAVFYENSTRRDIWLADFRVPASAGSTITWGTIQSFTVSEPRPLGDTYMTANGVLAAISAQSAPDAALFVKGRTKLSVEPAVPSSPIAWGYNDPLVRDAIKLQSRTVSASAPSSNQSLIWNSTASQWEPASGNISAGFVTVEDYGASADGVRVLDGAINSSSTTFTSVSSSFSTALIGKSIAVVGAGASGATLVTTITARPTTTTLTLAAAASTTVSAARTVYGTNNTTAFQNAVNGALAAGVRKVFAKKGNYIFFTGSVDIPKSVVLQGSWDSMPTHRAPVNGTIPCGLTKAEYGIMDGDGTTYVVTANEGVATGQMFKLDTDAALKGAAFYYPAEIPTLTTPKLYPWSIFASGSNITISEIEFYLPYQGIYSYGGDYNVVRNVIGQPLSIGLFVSQQYAVALYENITFITTALFASTEPNCGSPPYAEVPLVFWTQSNGIAYKIGRGDAARFVNCFAWLYNKGFYFINEPADPTFPAAFPGGTSQASFAGGGIDNCVYGVYIENADNITFTDFFLAAREYQDIAGTNATSIYISSSFDGEASFVNTIFRAGYHHVLYNAGATGWLNITSSHFENYLGTPIVLNGPTSGGTTGKVTFTGNRFTGDTGIVPIDIHDRMVGTFSQNFFNTTRANSFANSSTAPIVSCNDTFVVTDGSLTCGQISPLGSYNIAVDILNGWFYKPKLAFASLGAPANGVTVHCSDCTETSDPCTGGGTGSNASRLNGRWVCTK